MESESEAKYKRGSLNVRQRCWRRRIKTTCSVSDALCCKHEPDTQPNDEFPAGRVAPPTFMSDSMRAFVHSSSSSMHTEFISADMQCDVTRRTTATMLLCGGPGPRRPRRLTIDLHRQEARTCCSPSTLSTVHGSRLNAWL